MNSPSEPELSENDSDEDGVSAALLVGWIMVAVYLLSSVLWVFEKVLLSSFYPSQFAFLRSLFPSPAADDVLAWQDIVLFQAVPFLLFFYFAVRMGIDPLKKLTRTLVAIALVGVCLSLLNFVLSVYQDNISSLILKGSFAVTNSTPSISVVLATVLSPFELWGLLVDAIIFTALGVTGITFGNFSGETPYWILRSRLASWDAEAESSPPEDVGLNHEA